MPCSYILCDCNGLKMINDMYGHSAGDQYIYAAAKLLKEVAPGNQSLSVWEETSF